MELVQVIGAFAGLAAFLGLAAMSALLFSQAREIRRLREWAGRAPDRPPAPAPGGGAGPRRGDGDAAHAPAASAPGRGDSSPQGGPESGRSVPLRGREPVGAVSPGGSQAAAPAAAPAPAAQPASEAQAGRLASPVRAAGARPGPRAVPAPAPSRSARGERSANLLYVSLVVVGALIVLGAGAFAIGLVGGRDAPTTGERTELGRRSTAEGSTRADAPSSVTFSMLNGTNVDGLGKQFADKLEAAGYVRGNVTNAGEQRAESVVLYAQGAREEALAVGRKVGVGQVRPIDAGSQALAGDATVVVTAGFDKVR